MPSSIYSRLSQDSYFRMGYFYQMEGDLHSAAECYIQSIENGPNAEAHTFLAWILSQIGEIEDAIVECRKALKLDPDFGNAWNDMGAYMLEKGKHRKAIQYLKRACRSKNYDNLEFPHYNLARVYIEREMLISARKELTRALKHNPGFVSARQLLERLNRQLH